MTLFNSTIGPARVNLASVSRSQLDEDERKGLLVVDGRRARSHYFDGRFLAARDLTREQNYFLVRQADLTDAGSEGVIRGLNVERAGARALRIAAGQGATSAGELVTLARDTVVKLDNVKGIDHIDASSGLVAVTEAVPPTARSGIYVLALRPVEYSTRSITKYPTTVNGQRSIEKGDIAEAVAITLVPIVIDHLDDNPWHQRSRVAALAFMELGLRGIPAETLPLAMLRLDKGTIRWLDPYLVRRDIDAMHDGVVGLGVTPRVLREAHLLQYDQQLREIVAERQHGAGLRFAATDYFEVLPPAGRMPAAAIDPSDFSQVFFPPSMTVSLTIVPLDELATLLERSLLFSPIQISGAAEDLDFTTIHVLIPAKRQLLRSLKPHSIRRTTLAPSLPALRRPADILRQLALRKPSKTAIVPPSDPIAAQWRQLLTSQGDGMLWFARSRSMPLTVPVHEPLNPPRSEGG